MLAVGITNYHHTVEHHGKYKMITPHILCANISIIPFFNIYIYIYIFDDLNDIYGSQLYK